ncbi:MAG: SAM-dependent methyltransferase [Umezawaea sp.]
MDPNDHNTVDTTSPNAARVYDYWLGGGRNFAADRKLGERIEVLQPNIRQIARANRAFMTRAVQFAALDGIDQFLDLGCGIPTVGNVHEIACDTRPHARVVYVDTEPVAVAHMRQTLGRGSPHAVVQADFCRPEIVLDLVEKTGVLDLRRPVCLLGVALLHFIAPEREPERHLATYRTAVAPGSLLVLSHVTVDGVPEELARNAMRVRDAYEQTSTPGCFRTAAEFTALFRGWSLVDPPGVTWAPLWHPEHGVDLGGDDPATSMLRVGAARKLG